MKLIKISKSIIGMMACVAGSLFLMSHQASAQVTYTVTGFANNLSPNTDLLSPQVGLEESYTAVF